MHASCQRLPQTLTQLLLTGETGAGPSLAALHAFAEPRVKELTEALARVRRRTMTARRRLDLELAVASKTAELDAVRALSECLDEALTKRELHIDLAQLAAQALTSGGEAAGPRLHVALYGETADSELLVNPRLATQLVLLGLSWATGGGTRPARVNVSHGEGGGSLEIEALDAAEADSFTVGVPATIEPSLAALKVAASSAQATLTERPGFLRFQWGPELVQQR